jgi:hypothetical protein
MLPQNKRYTDKDRRDISNIYSLKNKTLKKRKTKNKQKKKHKQKMKKKIKWSDPIPDQDMQCLASTDMFGV